jgi:hypothetical protein
VLISFPVNQLKQGHNVFLLSRTFKNGAGSGKNRTHKPFRHAVTQKRLSQCASLDCVDTARLEKITLYIVAPADGKVAEILVPEGSKVPVGTVVGYVEGE